MIKLSVVIITFNEERNIGRCLESIKNIADEIVVVDSFSTDQTQEICKKYNARFVQHAFEGHIEQKNWAMEQAQHPYILSLDADEALSEKLEEEILETKANWAFDGYYFNRLTNYCGSWIKHCGWYPDKKLRLIDRRLGCWEGINPHDILILKKGSRQKYLKGDLLHYSYYNTREHIDQVNRFTELGAISAIKNGKSSNLIKILFKPLWKFIRDYFIKGGFLDGYHGFVICIVSAHATFIKYVKIKELKNK